MGIAWLRAVSMGMVIGSMSVFYTSPCCSTILNMKHLLYIAHIGINMSDRPAKLARLQNLRDRLPFISQSALCSLLKLAHEEELPEIHNRKALREARDAKSHAPTPYGTVCQIVQLLGEDGTHIPVEVQHPFAMLHQACLTSKPLSGLMKRCIEQHPPSLAKPWSLVLYTDEITPGNQLAYKSHRKFWAIYWSVLEWGPQVLSDEDMKQTSMYRCSEHAHAQHACDMLSANYEMLQHRRLMCL